MPHCIINDRKIEFTPGKNIIEVAKEAGIKIPYFCYHPGLSVVAQCRMCAVEIEKMPKLQTACSTLAEDAMVIKTASEKVINAQKSTMEFLLINHPLDCPICDKSGECDLQDFSYTYGDPYSRYTEERRTYLDLDMGPVIQKNMNRCIHCTRCIRFGEEIAGMREMVAIQRGNNTEITTIDGRSLETEYAGNYADICPTGSLTLKDFRFKKRVWFLKKTPTICEGCSRGCNMEIHQDGNKIYRCVPRENKEINQYWLCDEGRFHFHYVHDAQRIKDPIVQINQNQEKKKWEVALEKAKSLIFEKKITVLIGSDLTQEEASLIQKFTQLHFKHAFLFHYGTPNLLSSEQDAPADKILKMKSKTANLKGLESFGLKGYEKTPEATEAFLIFRGGTAIVPNIPKLPVIGVGVFMESQVQSFTVTLPGLSFAEKEGSIVNYEGRIQFFKKALLPLGKCKSLPEILMLWEQTAIGAAS